MACGAGRFRDAFNDSSQTTLCDAKNLNLGETGAEFKHRRLFSIVSRWLSAISFHQPDHLHLHLILANLETAGAEKPNSFLGRGPNFFFAVAEGPVLSGS